MKNSVEHLTTLLRLDLETLEFRCRKIRKQPRLLDSIDNSLQFIKNIAVHTLLLYRKILLQNKKHILCITNYM